ncbi:kinase [Nocardia donostiensis]|uniref:Kinase n=2 Tax=Nocardia donostiensis TaxID=1538463 RepID=A0A1V2TIF2_9NOCA|nr:kinase [Nocardia donostiensis]OQS21780.1 kinase [Nocardia donostiensis]
MTMSLPPDVVDNIREIFEERGERWLADLPEVVAKRCQDWALELIGQPFGGGTHSFVAPVRRADGSVAVLKIPVVDEENLGEAAGMFCYQGDGAVQLYDYDPESGALLLEWARPGTPLVRQPRIPLEGKPENAGKVQIACALYRRLRRPPIDIPPGYPPLPLVADMVAGWVEQLDEPDLAAPFPASLLARAHRWCAELAEPDGPLLIVNRDTHLGNIVAAEREPWLLIDPKAYLGEAAFDAGFLIMKQVESNPDPERARRFVAATAAELDIECERARGWAFMRAVEEVMWSVEDCRHDDVRRFLAVAQALS